MHKSTAKMLKKQQDIADKNGYPDFKSFLLNQAKVKSISEIARENDIQIETFRVWVKKYISKKYRRGKYHRIKNDYVLSLVKSGMTHKEVADKIGTSKAFIGQITLGLRNDYKKPYELKDDTAA